MTIEELGSLGELIAAIATVATLVYLSLQIRANTIALRAQSRRNSSSEAHNVTGILGSSKEAASVFRRGLVDPSALDPDEKSQFTSLLSMLVVSCQAAFEEYQLGIMDRELFESANASVLAFLKTPGGDDYWKAFGFTYTPRFRRFIDAAREQPAVSS